MAQIMQVKRKDGTFSKMWYSDVRIDGVRKHLALSKYKPQALAMLDDMVAVSRAHRRGGIVEDASWEFFKNRYLEFRKLKRNPHTYYLDRVMFEMVESVTSLTRLRQMTPERLIDIEMALSEQKEYGPASILRAIRGMKTAMRVAENWKYLPVQNWRIVEVIEPEGRIDFWTLDNYRILLSRLNGTYLLAALLGGSEGLRPGEIFHLEWPDIQFNHNRIFFRSKPKFNWKIKGDKKGKKIRRVPLFTTVAKLLRPLARGQGFVLGAERPGHEDTFFKGFSEAIKATGVKTYEGQEGFPYLLRHTFGTHMAQKGVPLRKIQEWMGHSSIDMTESYAHHCPEFDETNPKLLKNLCTTYVPGSDARRGLTVLLKQNNAFAENSKYSRENTLNA